VRVGGSTRTIGEGGLSVMLEKGIIREKKEEKNGWRRSEER